MKSKSRKPRLAAHRIAIGEHVDANQKVQMERPKHTSAARGLAPELTDEEFDAIGKPYREEWAAIVAKEQEIRKLQAQAAGLSACLSLTFDALKSVNEMGNKPSVLSAPAQPSKSKRGRKPKPYDDLLRWIYGRDFKNSKKVNLRDLSKIIEKHIAMTGGDLSSTTSSRIVRALKGAKIDWRQSEKDWIAKVTNP